MSGGTDQDRLEVIIDYLKQQNTALSTLDRRMDSLSIDVRVACESMKSVMERQAELERDGRNRHGHCAEVMDAMKTRIVALEQMISPIPMLFHPENPEYSEDQALRDTQKNNGGSESAVMSAEKCSEQPCMCGNCCGEDDDNEL